MDRSALLNAALKALIAREAARRLARLAGTEPDLQEVRRRRFDPEPTEADPGPPRVRGSSARPVTQSAPRTQRRVTESVKRPKKLVE
jgi:hypothetical protein